MKRHVEAKVIEEGGKNDDRGNTGARNENVKEGRETKRDENGKKFESEEDAAAETLMEQRLDVDRPIDRGSSTLTDR